MALFAVLALVAPAQGGARARPNVLFLFADDQRPDTIAALGNDHIRTPHLDALVRRGFTFSRAYCMGSMGGAVCVPSRAMVHSGRSLFQVDGQLSDTTTLGQVLRGEGYETFATGKWHNGTASFVRSFEAGEAVFFGGMSDHTRVPVRDLGPGGVLTEERVGAAFSNTLFADAAIDFLERRESERPFFLYVAFTAPHDPRQAPPGYIDLYDPDELPLPADYMPQHPFHTGWMTGRDEALAAWPRPKSVIRQQLAEYYGLISHMDHEIGRLLATLERTGQADDTVIVYAADHGLALGSHGLLGKQNLYDTSMRAPLIVAGAGIPHGQSDRLAYLFDVFTTICEVAGARLPDGVEGMSLAPCWRGDGGVERDSIYTAFGGVMRALRDDRWKLIRYPRINRSQLFDLRADPHELEDLAAEPEHAGRVEQMIVQLRAWQRRLGDRLPLTSDAPEPAAIDLTGRERKPDGHQPAWIVEKYFGDKSK